MYGHPTTPLLTLFETQTDNRMAYDYLMAWMLLERSERSLGAIAANVGHFRAIGYDSIPVHCQEALLILEKVSGTPIDLARIIRIGKPSTRVYYDLQEIGEPDLAGILDGFVAEHRLA